MSHPIFNRRILGGLAALVVLALAVFAFQLYQEISKAVSEDPLVWEKDIQALEARGDEVPANGDYVLFVGSSSIRLWDSLVEDMAPIAAVNRGFGGAKLNDLVYYAPRLVNALQPSALVVFAGTNDIDPRQAKQPSELLASYRAFIDIVRLEHPHLPIYFIAITPSPMRWEVWPVAEVANRLIADYSEGQENLFYIDTGPALLGRDGRPDENNYVFDGLHLSEQGYGIWRNIIRSRLMDDLGPSLAPSSVSQGAHGF